MKALRDGEYIDMTADEVAAFEAERAAWSIITPAHVKTEAQRRIIARVGADSLASCIVKQLNANMRATELQDIRAERDWTAQESAEAAALRNLAASIKAIRAASNTLEALSPIPSDYRDAGYWPG